MRRIWASDIPERLIAASPAGTMRPRGSQYDHPFHAVRMGAADRVQDARLLRIDQVSDSSRVRCGPVRQRQRGLRCPQHPGKAPGRAARGGTRRARLRLARLLRRSPDRSCNVKDRRLGSPARATRRSSRAPWPTRLRASARAQQPGLEASLPAGWQRSRDPAAQSRVAKADRGGISRVIQPDAAAAAAPGEVVAGDDGSPRARSSARYTRSRSAIIGNVGNSAAMPAMASEYTSPVIVPIRPTGATEARAAFADASDRSWACAGDNSLARAGRGSIAGPASRSSAIRHRSRQRARPAHRSAERGPAGPLRTTRLACS